MREIKSGDTIMRIRASSLAIFFYKQEFKTDILKAIGEICKDWLSNPKLVSAAKTGEESISDFGMDLFDIIPDGYTVMQITWALNKAQNVAENLQTPSFESWIAQYQDIAVLDILQDIIEESMQGFFRSAPKEKDPK